MPSEPSSSLYPDRPIRPLPKRRLRERLSPDVANSITYPPAPQTSTPLFVYPYSWKDDASLVGPVLAGASGRENVPRHAGDVGFRRNGLVAGQRDEEALLDQARRALGPRGFQEPAELSLRVPSRASNTRQPNPQPPPSTASSMDGYDSFENTNNKKKRKIPITGEAILNGAHILNDPATFGLPSPSSNGEDDNGEHTPTSTAYYQSGGPLSNGQGISGPGRGRYGRVRNGRSPLRTLSDSNGNWTGRNMKLRSTNQYPPSPTENSGIISTAIASAEKFPLPTGQENVSLLQQQVMASKPSTRASTQFTFTFGSQNPVSWPGYDPAPRNNVGSNRTHPGAGGSEYHGTIPRGSQKPSSLSNGSSSATIQNSPHAASDQHAKGGSNTAGTPKKSKRLGDSLLRAARRRRRETEYQNMHHPLSPENYYLCEFCEYELIFGHPPEALIRQYELKDRRRRRDEAERRRLLEKAKLKSRKGKKSSGIKTAVKNNASADRSSITAHEPHHPPPVDRGHEPDEGGEIHCATVNSDSRDDLDSNEGRSSQLTPKTRYPQSAPEFFGDSGGKSEEGGPLRQTNSNPA
ncbi:hypothetical protein F5Y17DRAFT_422763 [Xylariaceae sp. FL0594]|nr:hypothetical protein F5Y17DRAFT_422763 [Xylariaceae sp. FL0594]